MVPKAVARNRMVLARSGPLDLRPQAEVHSARKSATPRLIRRRASQQDQVLGCRSVPSRQVGVALRNSCGLRRHLNSPALPTERRNHVLLSRATAAIPWEQLDGDKRTRFVGEEVLSPKQRLSL